MLNKYTLFRPSKPKVDKITSAVRGITEAETSAREAKTQRLRAIRLGREEGDKEQYSANPLKKARKLLLKAKSAD